MTTLDKLRKLRTDFYNNDKLEYDSLDFFTSIEKDLEVLEILKNVLCFRIQLYDVHSDGSYKSYEFLDVKDDINSLEGKERYKIIKQWLEEEQK